jgi:DNA-binding transcriptional LysR family regulator
VTATLCDWGSEDDQGTVRIAATDTLCAMLVRPLPALRAAHPAILLEVTVSNVLANLMCRAGYPQVAASA